MKKIIKNFNNLVKRTIFKVQNKTNNNFNISGFNRYLITFIVVLFFYLFYLLIPVLYDKTWVQANIEKKLLKEFKINISNPVIISYRILPSPHFLIKDVKILMTEGEKNKSIAEIKNFQIFLSQKNFFDKKKMNIKKIIISNANFSLLRGDFKFLNTFRNKKFSNKEIQIINSKIFIKNNLKEIISIIKINKMILFFDNQKLLNFLNLKGEVFKIPFVFDFINHNNSNIYEKINFNFKPLQLNILNEFIKEKNNYTTGTNIVSFLNSQINTKYNIKEKLITFNSDNSKLNNSQINYDGKLSINPFDLDLNINLKNHKISKLFNFNTVLIEFIKSKLLFNDNISVNGTININSNTKNEIFQNAKINFHIINGKINFNQTKFVNNDIGSLRLNNSNIFLKDNELIFNSELFIDVENSNYLFSFLNTKKSSRKDFKTITVNLDYNFLKNKIKFNNLKIDNSDVDNQLLSIIDEFNDDNLNNLNNSRRLLNKLFQSYAG